MTNCEICHKKNLFHMTQYWTGNQRWGQCRNCRHWQLEAPPQGLDLPPRVLYLDIERSLMSFWGYERKVISGYISKECIRSEAFIICWAACWIGETKIQSSCVTQNEALKNNDKRILQELWDLIDQSDYVTGHNVDKFDIKKLNNRFLIYEMGTPFGKSIDTLKLARKHFPFDSNALAYISKVLGGKPKKEINLNDWIRIVETGDPAALQKSERYCRGDVRMGINVFNKFKKQIESRGTLLYK